MTNKKKVVKGFTDDKGVIAESIKGIMDYWKEADPLVAPRTEGQFLEMLLVNYLRELQEKAPQNFDARNMFNL